MSSDIWIGVATFAMAVLGGVVAVSPPKEGQVWLRWIYVSAFTVLGIIGLFFVIKQSNEAAVSGSKLTQSLGDLKNSTTEMSRVEDLNAQLQQRLVDSSAMISSLAKQNLVATTGGNGYCWLVPMSPLPVGLGGDPAYQGDNWWQLGVKNSGTVVLPTCDLHFVPFPTAQELKAGVFPSPPDLFYHFEKVPIILRRYYRSTPYYIRGGRIYSGVIQTPTHSFIEVIKFEPDPNNRARFVPNCLVQATSGKKLETDCNPQK
jgi:hypothetical protein